VSDPLVTVITPTYNCAKFLLTAVSSVLSQSYYNVEYLVLDDGSTDLTQDLLVEIRDRRLTRIWDRNKGETLTVNKGIELATGKYFIIVNADDFIGTNCIKSLVTYMEENKKVLLTYPDWVSTHESGRVKSFIRVPEFSTDLEICKHFNLPGPGSMYRTKEVIRKVGFRDPTFKYIADLDYFWRISLTGPVRHLEGFHAYWRNRKGQLSSQRSKLMAEDHIKLVDKLLVNPLVPKELVLNSRELYFWSYLVALAISKNPNYLKKAITIWPEGSVKWSTYSGLLRYAHYILRR